MLGIEPAGARTDPAQEKPVVPAHHSIKPQRFRRSARRKMRIVGRPPRSKFPGPPPPVSPKPPLASASPRASPGEVGASGAVKASGRCRGPARRPEGSRPTAGAAEAQRTSAGSSGTWRRNELVVIGAAVRPRRIEYGQACWRWRHSGSARPGPRPCDRQPIGRRERPPVGGRPCTRRRRRPMSSRVDNSRSGRSETVLVGVREVDQAITRLYSAAG